MATNKHAQIRYHALDKCFSNIGRKFFISDLVDACNKAIYDFTGKRESVKKRQVYDDIKFMESSQGWSIDLDRKKEGRNVYFRYANKHYSINQSPLNQVELNQIQEVLLTLSRFRGMPQFEWVEEISERLTGLTHGTAKVSKIIDFEQNQFLKGLDFISDLFNAISNQRVLEIKYLPFTGSQEITYAFHPYYLKQYNLRWFLFGRTSYDNKITNVALDRIVSINEKPEAFIPNLDIDFYDYFEDIIGVSVPVDAKSEKIMLLISSDLWPYIMTKPLHGSQRPPQAHQDGQIIELNVIINYELISRLLSFGDGVKVLSPSHLVESMSQKVEKMRNVYLAEDIHP